MLVALVWFIRLLQKHFDKRRLVPCKFIDDSGSQQSTLGRTKAESNWVGTGSRARVEQGKPESPGLLPHGAMDFQTP